MFKLLINTPSGAQETIEVGEGGGYFDDSRVLWDEREDGLLPAITLGGMVWLDGELVFNQARMDEHVAAITPAVQVPVSVTMRQARLALLAAGMLATVTSAVAAMTGPEGEAARIEWEFSSEVRRNQPLVLALAPTLGLTEAQLDSLFIAAAAL